MPGNSNRKKLLKQGLNLEILKRCPSFENAKTSTYRAQIWHKLSKEYYQEIKKPSTSKVSQLYYLYKKTIGNQNLVVQNVQENIQDFAGMFFRVAIEEISFQLDCFECNWQRVYKVSQPAKFYLKAHRQISEKRCFEKYCSCDKAYQFSAL